MLKKKKAKYLDEQYLMANIRVALMRQKRMKPADFSFLLEINDWSDIRSFLSSFGYSLSEKPTPDEIDELYRSHTRSLKEKILALQLPEELVDIFFVRTNSVQRLGEVSLVDFDGIVLDRFNALIEENLHPLITEYAKMKIDFYFIHASLRKHTITDKYLSRTKGFLSREDVRKLAGLDFETTIATLAKGHYHKLCKRPLARNNLDVYFDREIADLFTAYRHDVIGVEGIFHYIYEKRLELFDLRCALKGKCYRMPVSELQKRMRNIHV